MKIPKLQFKGVEFPSVSFLFENLIKKRIELNIKQLINVEHKAIDKRCLTLINIDTLYMLNRKLLIYIALRWYTLNIKQLIYVNHKPVDIRWYTMFYVFRAVNCILKLIYLPTLICWTNKQYMVILCLKNWMKYYLTKKRHIL